MSNTGTLFIDSDVALSFASGHDYSSPNVAATPEPSTWAMTLLGFCGLAFVAQRRKRSRHRLIFSAELFGKPPHASGGFRLDQAD
jgi:hypothetical protein